MVRTLPDERVGTILVRSVIVALIIAVEKRAATNRTNQEQAPEMESLDARTQVLEQMVGYFSALREDPGGF